MTSRKRFIATVLFLMMVGGVPHANSQTLDDAIDAELDDASAGLAPSATAKGGVDDIQLDDGGADAAPKTTAKAPEPPPATPAAPEVTAPAPDVSPAPSTPAATEGGPSPGVVEDELKLDDTPTSTTADSPKTDAAPDVQLDTDDTMSKPAQNVEPTPLEENASAPDQSLPPADEDSTLGEPGLKPSNPPKTPGVPDAPKIATTAPSVVIDSGNAAYEKRLSKISRGYKQVPDVNWDEIVADRRQENYSLQRGDTLWDISSTFFGDGFFWAKLWSQNGVIGNPHRILKGKAIKFVAGTEADAPAIGVTDVTKTGGEFTMANPLNDPELDRPTYREQVQSEVTPEEIESGVVLETDELIPAPDLPPPNRRTPVLKNLPKSFAESHIEADADYDATGLKNAPSIKANVAPSVYVNSFILDGAPDDIGKVDEIETSEKVASTGQSIFVKANKELTMGQRLTFVRRRERPAGAAGPVVDVEGVGVVDGVVKENTNTYHVTVTTALFPVEKGALVLEEPPPRVTVSREGRRSDAHVKVVGGEFDDQRKVLGMPSIIYLNGGSQNGLAKGDLIGISATRGTRREDTKYPTYSRAIALVKIADVRSKVATAIVLSAYEPIMIGDMTSGEVPEDLPALTAESADESATAFGQEKPATVK